MLHFGVVKVCSTLESTLYGHGKPLAIGVRAPVTVFGPLLTVGETACGPRLAAQHCHPHQAVTCTVRTRRY